MMVRILVDLPVDFREQDFFSGADPALRLYSSLRRIPALSTAKPICSKPSFPLWGNRCDPGYYS
jgi:hypothetical protein